MSTLCPEARQLIAELDMQPIPQEGAWFAPGARTERLSCITGMLADTDDGFSAMHRLSIDEGWQFLDGDPAEVTLLHADGTHTIHRLDQNIAQLVIPAGTWMGARTLGRWSHFSCWCTPVFTPDCFELGRYAALIASHPGASAQIAALTRG